MVICKTWTVTLANTADPDQTPQNAVSDQGLHCLFKLQEDKCNWNRPRSWPFFQPTFRDKRPTGVVNALIITSFALWLSKERMQFYQRLSSVLLEANEQMLVFWKSSQLHIVSQLKRHISNRFVFKRCNCSFNKCRTIYKLFLRWSW